MAPHQGTLTATTLSVAHLEEHLLWYLVVQLLLVATLLVFSPTRQCLLMLVGTTVTGLGRLSGYVLIAVIVVPIACFNYFFPYCPPYLRHMEPAAQRQWEREKKAAERESRAEQQRARQYHGSEQVQAD